RTRARAARSFPGQRPGTSATYVTGRWRCTDLIIKEARRGGKREPKATLMVSMSWFPRSAWELRSRRSASRARQHRRHRCSRDAGRRNRRPHAERGNKKQGARRGGKREPEATLMVSSSSALPGAIRWERERSPSQAECPTHERLLAASRTRRGHRRRGGPERRGAAVERSRPPTDGSGRRRREAPRAEIRP